MANCYYVCVYLLFMLLTKSVLCQLRSPVYTSLHTCDIYTWSTNTTLSSIGVEYTDISVENYPYHDDEGKIVNMAGDDRSTLFQYESGKISGLGVGYALQMVYSEPRNYTDIMASECAGFGLLNNNLYCYGSICSHAFFSTINGSILSMHGYNGTIGFYLTNGSFVWITAHDLITGDISRRHCDLSEQTVLTTINLNYNVRHTAFLSALYTTLKVEWAVILLENDTLIVYNHTGTETLRYEDVKMVDCGGMHCVAVYRNKTAFGWVDSGTYNIQAIQVGGYTDIEYVWTGGGSHTGIPQSFTELILTNGSIIHIGYAIPTNVEYLGPIYPAPAQIDVSNIKIFAPGYFGVNIIFNNDSVIGWGTAGSAYIYNTHIDRMINLVTGRYSTAVLSPTGYVQGIGATPMQTFWDKECIVNINGQVDNIMYELANGTLVPFNYGNYDIHSPLVKWDASYTNKLVSVLVFEDGSGIYDGAITNISAYNYTNCTCLCAGYNFAVIVTNGNQIYVVGTTGVSSDIYNYPTNLGNIESVKCGRFHVVALLANKTAITWGPSTISWGFGDPVHASKLLLSSPLYNVKLISTTFSYSAVLYENDTVYTWGELQSLSVGLLVNPPVIDAQIPVTETRKIIALSCGIYKLTALVCDTTPETTYPPVMCPTVPPTTTTPEPTTTTTPEPTTPTPTEAPANSYSSFIVITTTIPVVVVVLFLFTVVGMARAPAYLKGD